MLSLQPQGLVLRRHKGSEPYPDLGSSPRAPTNIPYAYYDVQLGPAEPGYSRIASRLGVGV